MQSYRLKTSVANIWLRSKHNVDYFISHLPEPATRTLQWCNDTLISSQCLLIILSDTPPSDVSAALQYVISNAALKCLLSVVKLRTQYAIRLESFPWFEDLEIFKFLALEILNTISQKHFRKFMRKKETQRFLFPYPNLPDTEFICCILVRLSSNFFRYYCK